MNKKIFLIFMFLLMLFSVSFASADTCQREFVLESLRKALYVYYIDPSKSTFTVGELKGLLAFYVSIEGVEEEILCEPTEKSLADKAYNLDDKIPSCSDGTKYGKCSTTRPMYCYAGNLVPRCRLCGCPEGQWCDEKYVDTSKGNKGQWGKCYPIDNVTNVTFDLALRIADCATLNTDCESGTGYEGIETYGCALEGATVKLEALNKWNSYSAQLVVNSGEHSEVGDAPAGRSEWIVFKNIPVWTGTRDYTSDKGFYRITVTKDGYTSKTGLIGIFGTTGADLYWSREFIGNYICLKATPTTCTPQEQLIVDFRSLSGTTTTSTYSGQVSISVVGTGQSSGIAYNDAFYVFTSYLNGQPITPIVQNPFLLYVDGKPVSNVTSVPTYNSQHNHKFTFDVGTTPKKINFKIGDTYVVDNSGSFTIGICTDAVGKCLDGTPYGQCSATKPKYCDNGVLKDNCQTCGCSTGTCQTNGTCAPAGEIPTGIITRGRMIDAVTGEPYANLLLMSGTPAVTLAKTDSNGYFNFTFSTDNFTSWSSSGNLTEYQFSFAFWPSCGYQGGIAIRWNSTKEGFVGFSVYLDACEFRPFSSTNEIDLGTFKLWPAAAITIKSDVPFKTILHPLPNTCPTYTKSIGSTQYTLEFHLADMLPVNHRTEINLTLQNGSEVMTTSDIIKPEQKCQTVQLNYYNGQFSWGQTCSDGTTYGQCSTTKPKYCSNGTLIDNCQVCGCDIEQICQSNNSCIKERYQECYQETATEANDCGGLDTGSYTCRCCWYTYSGDPGPSVPNNCSGLFDGNWRSFSIGHNTGTIDITYAKPINSTILSKLQVGVGNVAQNPSSWSWIYNISIPPDCWERDEQNIFFQLSSYYNPDFVEVSCYNSTGTVILYRKDGTRQLVEEAMIWELG